MIKKKTGGGAGGAVDSAPYSNLRGGSNALGSEWSAAYRHQNIEEKEQHQQYAVVICHIVGIRMGGRQSNIKSNNM